MIYISAYIDVVSYSHIEKLLFTGEKQENKRN